MKLSINAVTITVLISTHTAVKLALATPISSASATVASECSVQLLWASPGVSPGIQDTLCARKIMGSIRRWNWIIANPAWRAIVRRRAARSS
ncbi:hypothetical protein AJ78_01392 [Emergomyces pasteurianus Ep9510]|uniref:Secreted protein n=1 Tax=Emergomyces pasteurianus Ep9510 TaxID=1447872 RepID=A0A1J9QTL4_9EURO|nr:hypothetical protein AJ78_01392 [Emergomyces pasteurianus Ep9510]